MIRAVREKNNVTQEELAKAVNLKGGSSCVKDIELDKRHPSKKVAENMAVFFNLTKDYFFDEYLRTVDKIPDILKAYRNKNNLTISEACSYAGVSKTAWISWEHKTKQVNRINFEKLKANRIIFH